MTEENNQLVPANYYQPSELLNIFKNFLTHKEINMTLVCLKGVYIKSDKVYGQVGYDHLKDENGADEITIIVPIGIRNDLKNGNLVTVFPDFDYASPILDFSIFRRQNRHFCPRLVSSGYQTRA